MNAHQYLPNLACFSACAGSCKKKWLNITTSTTFYLTRVITLQRHHRTEYFLYACPTVLSSYKNHFSKSQMTQLSRYYIRMGQTRKCNCGLTPDVLRKNPHMSHTTTRNVVMRSHRQAPRCGPCRSLLLLLLYTGLGLFRALKVQPKLVSLGGGVCFLKTVNTKKHVFKVILWTSGDLKSVLL